MEHNNVYPTNQLGFKKINDPYDITYVLIITYLHLKKGKTEKQKNGYPYKNQHPYTQQQKSYHIHQ